MKYKECAKHNKNLTEGAVSTKTVSIVSKSLYLDYENACTAMMNISEEDKYKDALCYTANFDGEYDITVYKILVDNGAVFTPVNESIESQNLKNIRGARLD